jgi:YidC/Oxa1 family membrane protein insertase
MLQFIGTVFDTVFLHPIVNLLMVFYKLFLSVGLPGAFGFSIIALTLLIRFVLHPFFKQSMELSKKMQELKPHLDEISKKHKKDPKKMQKEQLKLYQDAGVNPASGCLFALIQMPIFIALYRTFTDVLLNADKAEEITKINSMLYSPLLEITKIDPNFFSFNLAMPPAKAGEWYYYVIPVVTAILQFIQAQHMPMGQPVKKDDDSKKLKDGSNKKSKDNKGEENKSPMASEDFQKALSMQMRYFFPLMLGWLSYTLPVGLSLYWNIFSLFTIFQHRKTKDEKKEK